MSLLLAFHSDFCAARRDYRRAVDAKSQPAAEAALTKMQSVIARVRDETKQPDWVEFFEQEFADVQRAGHSNHGSKVLSFPSKSAPRASVF